MKTKRNRFVNVVVDDVAKGFFSSYTRKFTGQFIWGLKKGRDLFMQEADLEADGFTITLSDGHSRTQVYLTDIDEVKDLIENQEMKSMEIAEYAKSLSAFLSAPENAKWRS